MYITGKKKLKDKICKVTVLINYQRKLPHNKLLNEIIVSREQ